MTKQEVMEQGEQYLLHTYNRYPLVLDHGQVAELGTHDQLIQRPGIYQDIYNIQMSSDDRRLVAEGGEA